jgi:hypothetical protein
LPGQVGRATLTLVAGLAASPPEANPVHMPIARLRQRIRYLLMFFVAALVLSGLTAFPLAWEANGLNQIMIAAQVAQWWPALAQWIARIALGLQDTQARYPFILYGTDWLAFAHLVIALAFWGPLKDPVRNVWVVEFGLLACGLVLPLALIAGPVRGIPPFWIALDCSFGVIGLIPLWLARRDISQLARLARSQ